MKDPWRPRPIDTRAVQLPRSLAELVEFLAENAHDHWGRQRLEDGWRWGPGRDDVAKTHPLLIPYGDLPDAEKVYDRRMAMETLKVVLRLGYRIEDVGSPAKKRSSAMPSLLRRFRISISTVVFLLGVVLMLWSSTHSGIWWSFLGNIGMFVAAAVAIPFYYEIVLRDHERWV